MKQFRLAFLGICAILLLCLTSCERVAPNFAGVLMENYGKSGKADFSIQQGRVSTISPGTELFQVPLWEQRASFGDSDDEAKQVLHLQASDQTAFTSKPTYSYTVIKERAVDVVFQNKQLSSGDKFMRSLEDNILEAKIYDIMKDRSRSYSTDTLMARGGSLAFENNVKKLVEAAFLEKGLQLETFTAQLEFSKKVTEKIDNRNEVNTNITVLDQKISEQKKTNALIALQAEGNLIRSRGLTPEILQEKAIAKWNGQLNGSYLSGNIPFVKNIR